jgi:hypothetical protein
MRLVCGNVHSVGFVEPRLLPLVERLQCVLDDVPPPCAPPEILGPGTALEDASLAAASTLAGRGMDSSEDRASLRDDLALAIEQLGPAVQEVAKLSLGEVRRQLPHLPALIQEVRGAEALKALVEGVSAELGSSAVVLAAWADLLDSFFGSAPAAECELRLLQLGEIVDLRGGDWTFMGNEVRKVLWDDRGVMEHAGLVEKIEDEPEAPGASGRIAAGLSTEERLDHCATLLAREPAAGDLTVWLGFAKAELGTEQLSLGRIELFDAKTGVDFLRAGGRHGDPDLREEFEDDFLSEYVFGYIGGSEVPPVVLARVKLGEGLFGPSMRRGRRLVEDMIRTAKPGTEWQIMSGSFTFVRGDSSSYWSGRSHETRKEMPQPQYHFEAETAERLAALDPAVIERLFAGEPTLHSAVGDIDWLERVMEIGDQSQRVALGLRLIERLLPRTREQHWNLALKRYVRDVWCQRRIQDFVIDTGYNAAWVIDFQPPNVVTQNPYDPRRYSLHGEDGHDFGEHLRVMEALPNLVDLVPPDPLQSRTVHELAERMASAGSVLAWKAELAASFDRLTARAGRQRNAILHGADTNEQVVGSLEQFLGGIQSYLSQQALLAANRGVPLSTQLEARRMSARRSWQALEEGQLPVAALFNSAPEPGTFQAGA